MTDKKFHILFEQQEFDFKLSNAYIRLERNDSDDYELGDYEFFLENIDHLDFNVDTIFRLYNDMLDISYVCIVVKTYPNKLALKIIEWSEY